MADVKLSDGREINIDLLKITYEEYEALLDVGQSDIAGNEIIGKCVGMTGKELDQLPLLDYKRVLQKFYRMARQPVPEDDSEKN